MPTTAIVTSPSGFSQPRHDLVPARQIGARLVRQPEMPEQLGVDPLLVVADRHLVDVRGVERRDHGVRLHVALERDLAPGFGRDRPLGAAKQHVGLDADAAQLAHRMLGRLGLELARRGEIGHQRQMHVGDAIAAELEAELADRLEERQALDVADRAADLAEHEIDVVDVGQDELLDHVGDVRHHLDRAAEIVAVALAREHPRIDPARGDAVDAARRARR